MAAIRDEWGGLARLQAEVRRSRELAATAAWLAGQVAEIEDEVATTLERMAGIGPADRTERLLAKAEHARSVAEHERVKQVRWQRVHDGGSPTEPA